MIVGFLVLVSVDLLGEWIRQRFALAAPGPLIGLVLLTACLYLWPRLATRQLRSGARILLTWMSMFFVPAGTGVITRMHQIRSQWLSIAVALCVSTAAALLVTAWAMRAFDSILARWISPDNLG